MTIPFDVPADFAARYAAKELVRYGTLLKDAGSGRIVAHLQETGGTHALLELAKNLPLNPFKAVEVVSSVAANLQLYRLDAKIERTMDLLRLGLGLQTGGLAMAALGLGVTIAGFARVKKRMDALSVKLDGLSELVLREFQDQRHRELLNLEGDLDSQLDHAEEAWRNSDGGTRVWTRVADRLNDMVYYYPNLIDAQLRSPAPDLEVLAYLLERYRVLAATRVECLMLIGEPETARQFSLRFSTKTNSILDRVSPVELARRRAAIATHGSDLRRQLPEVTAFVQCLREFQDTVASRPLLLQTLVDRNVDGRDYVAQMRELGTDPLIMIPAA